MGLLDWVTLGRIDRNGACAGEFHLTLGTSWNATGGSSYEHVIGSSMNLTLDPVEMVMSPLYAGGQAIISNAILGMGGSSDFVYGSSTQAIYGGPSFQLQRARELEKKSDWFLRPRKLADSVPPPDPLEPTTAIAIKVLSLLINVVPLAMEIALYAGYKDYYDPAKDGKIEKEPELLKFMAYGITTRLMAMVRTLEVATAKGQIGDKLLEELAPFVNALISARTAIISRIKTSTKEGKEAAQKSREAQQRMNELLEDMRAGKAW